MISFRTEERDADGKAPIYSLSEGMPCTTPKVLMMTLRRMCTFSAATNKAQVAHAALLFLTHGAVAVVYKWLIACPITHVVLSKLGRASEIYRSNFTYYSTSY